MEVLDYAPVARTFIRKLNIIYYSIFKQNNYPQNFVNQCMKKFFNKLFIKKDLNLMAPKRELTSVLLYLGGKLSIDLRTRLR